MSAAAAETAAGRQLAADWAAGGRQEGLVCASTCRSAGLRPLWPVARWPVPCGPFNVQLTNRPAPHPRPAHLCGLQTSAWGRCWGAADRRPGGGPPSGSPAAGCLQAGGRQHGGVRSSGAAVSEEQQRLGPAARRSTGRGTRAQAPLPAAGAPCGCSASEVMPCCFWLMCGTLASHRRDRCMAGAASPVAPPPAWRRSQNFTMPSTPGAGEWRGGQGRHGGMHGVKLGGRRAAGEAGRHRQARSGRAARRHGAPPVASWLPSPCRKAREVTEGRVRPCSGVRRRFCFSLSACASCTAPGSGSGRDRDARQGSAHMAGAAGGSGRALRWPPLSIPAQCSAALPPPGL